MKTNSNNINQLELGVRNGDRVALSQSITLAESTLPNHQKQAHELIQRLLPWTGKSKRIAITGVPGVGKSTFIEGFGKMLVDKGHKVAVLAIDPSSTLSKGSILGDKTRMEDLSREVNAYIRPSASSGYLGGIASRTYEAMLLCEAAGFDVVLIETVGVGQSETLVNDMTDLFLFLQIPGAGDELQGIKRGIMEMADLIFINKVDQFGLNKAKEVKVTLAQSLFFLPPKTSQWKRKTTIGSGYTGEGLEECWELVQKYFDQIQSNGYLKKRRLEQSQLRIREYIQEQVIRKTMQIYQQNPISSEEVMRQNPYLLAEKWVAEKLGFKE